MKKIISLIASISIVFALSTSVFAYDYTKGYVDGTAVVDTTFETDAEGFTFTLYAQQDVDSYNYKVDVTDMEKDGWVISDLVTFVDGKIVNNRSTIQASATAGASGEGLGLVAGTTVVLQFKATPGANTTIEGSKFIAFGMYKDIGATTNTENISKANGIVYTIKEKKTEAKVEATTDAVTGVTTVTYPEGQTGALAGKKIALGTVSGSNVIDADTKISVSYNGGEAKIFDGLLAALGVTDSTTLTVGDIQFGVVYDDADGIADAKLFTFALVTE